MYENKRNRGVGFCICLAGLLFCWWSMVLLLRRRFLFSVRDVELILLHFRGLLNILEIGRK